MAKSTNKKEEPIRAKIIGLWGDPGMTEYYNFDFLSRFLLVQVSPYNEIPCGNDSSGIIKLVLRPRSLWIDLSISGGVIQRKDYFGNRNTQITGVDYPALNGLNSASYSTSNIQLISPAYKVGDEITLNRLAQPLCHQLNGDLKDKNRMFEGKDIYSSGQALTAVSLMSTAYKNSSGDSALSALTAYSYISGTIATDLNIVMNSNGSGGYNQAAYAAAFQKIIMSSGKYSEFLNAPGSILDKLLSILRGGNLIIARGGLFKRFVYSSVDYIDSNTENRTRLNDTGCLPLIVASPSTFPTPVSRNLGGVNITL